MRSFSLSSSPSSAWERPPRSSASQPRARSKQSFATCVPKQSLGTRAVALLSAVSLMTFSGCNGDVTSGQPSPTKSSDKPAATASTGARVETILPRRRTSKQPAQVEAKEHVDVVVKVAGYLKSFDQDASGQEIDTGSPLKAGQVLARLSVPELDQELKLKQATLRATQAGVLAAKEKKVVAVKDKERYEADLEFRESEMRRTEQLVRDRAVPPDVLDEKRKQWKAAGAALAAAGAKISEAEADITVAETKVEVARHDADRVAELVRYATITAPSRPSDALYVVTRRWADPGAYLQPGAGGQRDAVVSLVRLDQVRVVINVPELDAAHVDIGDPAVFEPIALPGKRFEGRISRCAWALDLPARTMRVEMDLPNPNGRSLYPGLYGDATIMLLTGQGHFLLPADAVRKEEGKAFVFAVVNGKAERIEVKLGRAQGTQVEITGGLQALTPVIRAPRGELKSGDPVVTADAKKP
jgi:HlyD family secretion protein